MPNKRKNKPGIKTGLLYWVVETSPFIEDSVTFGGISAFSGGLFRDGQSQYKGRFKAFSKKEIFFAKGSFCRFRSPRLGGFPVCRFDDPEKRDQFLSLEKPFLLSGETSIQLVLSGTFLLFPTELMERYYPAGDGQYFVAGKNWTGFVYKSEKREGIFRLNASIFSTETELMIQECHCFDCHGRFLGEISHVKESGFFEQPTPVQ